MTLIRSTLVNGLAVFVKALVGLLINKILAVWVGPTGYGIVGQMQSFTVAITTMSAAGINAGIVKYTSEYEGSIKRLAELWSNTVFISIASSITTSATLLIFDAEIAELLFGSSLYSDVIVWLSSGLVFISLNSVLISILNGKKSFAEFAQLNIIHSLLFGALSLALTWAFQIKGALISIVVCQSAAFVFTVGFLWKKNWFAVKNFIAPFSLKVVKKLSRFAMIGLATSVIGPLTLMLIRSSIIENLGPEECGQWEALNRLSGAYLMFISFPLSTYILPKLSSTTSKGEILLEIRRCLILYVGVATVLSSGLYLVKNQVIVILFTEEFLPVGSLMLWQIIGDVTRVAAWVYSFFFISKALIKQFVICELVGSMLYVAGSVLLLGVYGTLGVPIAYCLSNVVYLAILVILSKKYIHQLV